MSATARNVLRRMLESSLPDAETTGLAPFQQIAVRRIQGILDRFGGALLADETGLGKTWVAAAVAREQSGWSRPVEVFVPATLVEFWRTTL
ncbi:MAG TPA: hypothetical protein VM534_07235, partial [Thermoanaerobaculia bacterium]|nr:hypothetical protein [Thermoanaerobaculia bacterium]